MNLKQWDAFVVAGDIHGDKQDPKAVKAFFRFVDDFKPTIRVINGDAWDFRPLRTKASAEERRESMKADVEGGNTFIERFKPTAFNRGNHDERLWDLAIKGDGVLSDYAAKASGEIEETLRKMKCPMNPYDKRKGIVRIGSLKCVHGFGGAGVNAARRHAQIYGSVLASHFHSIQQASIEGLENRIGRIIGCLCYLDMDYNRAHTGSLMHRHGFAYGVTHRSSGLYHCYQAEEVGGVWMLPSDFRQITA